MNRDKPIEKLILQLGADKTVLEKLYTELKTDVYAFALSKIHNRFDAEDIVQDTFIQIYKNANLYKPQGKPMAWIFAIENNLILAFFNRNNKFESYDDSIDSSKLISDDDFEKEFDEESKFKQLLSPLNDEEKQIIVLHVVSSLKFIEIANLLKMPLSTVISKYNRSIKKIRKNEEGR